jgi:glyoxylase-like metal-dependent hydrolase (beta-lactamase superfamily II)
MTLDGTNTWVLESAGQAVVIDPGPLRDGHGDAINEAITADKVTEILLTHHHNDHASGARELAEVLRCPVRALDPSLTFGAEGLQDGAAVTVGDLKLHVLATPGHTADSISFWSPQHGAVMTGDTVLGRGTTLVAHPDGQLGAYLDSLALLGALCVEHEVDAVWPGHGPVLENAAVVIDYYLAHRRERLAQVGDAIATLRHTSKWGAITREEPLTKPRELELAQAVVELVYADVDPSLWPAAQLSVQAQLQYLAETGHL